MFGFAMMKMGALVAVGIGSGPTTLENTHSPLTIAPSRPATLTPIRRAEQDPEDADYGDGSRAALVELDDDAYGDGNAAPMEPSVYALSALQLWCWRSRVVMQPRKIAFTRI